MRIHAIICLMLAAAVLVAGCSDDKPDPDKLVIISPHNNNIKAEFGEAFKEWMSAKHGRTITLQWRDIGGGGSAIQDFLLKQYSASDSCGIDVLWGGGEPMFMQLANEGVTQPMKLSDDILANVPETFGGVRMYGPKKMWCGSAVSGFGFLYNKQLLDTLKLPEPRLWDDLADGKYYDTICLADPTQSGSAAAAYEMIVQSEPTWPQGWAKLMAVLGNAKRFLDSSSAVANAPARGEAPVAACIDFYGTTRVTEAPDILVYVSPKGQTAFSPDPIGILKNPPNADLAQLFVDFVLSRKGQALWCLNVGSPDGPKRFPLGRQPIRKDVYTAYKGHFSPWVINPYAAGGELVLDTEMRQLRYDVLKQLVRAAAIDNRELLKDARKVITEASNPALLAEYNRLPENVKDAGAISATAIKLKDPVQAELVTSGWADFFRNKYKRITE